ncbi:UNVERIFIED_CONTAM: hypothetical protein FKN15_037136 [Acipenser sinensis]
MIAEAYREVYGRDLIADLKENLSDHFKQVMVGLMYPPVLYDVHELWHAMKIPDKPFHADSLHDSYYASVPGGYANIRQSALICQLQQVSVETQLMPGVRAQGYADPVMAAQDAMVLWEACKQKTGGHKNMLQMILCNKSYQQLWMVLCLRDRSSYFAYRLYNAIHELGFHNKTVIRILVSRSEVDLMNIRRRYKERYGKSLFHDIKVPIYRFSLFCLHVNLLYLQYFVQNIFSQQLLILFNIYLHFVSSLLTFTVVPKVSERESHDLLNKLYSFVIQPHRYGPETLT